MRYNTHLLFISQHALLNDSHFSPPRPPRPPATAAAVWRAAGAFINLLQPWAWESREFLRHALIGQQVVYTVEYKAPESGRAIGTVVINGENIAKSVAQSGWARVRRPPDGKEPRGYVITTEQRRLYCC